MPHQSTIQDPGVQVHYLLCLIVLFSILVCPKGTLHRFLQGLELYIQGFAVFMAVDMLLKDCGI